MENNEKYIKGKLLNHREELDLDQLWTTVEPHINSKKKRRPILWLFFTLGMLFLAGLAYISLGYENDPKTGLESFAESMILDHQNNAQIGISETDEIASTIIQNLSNSDKVNSINRKNTVPFNLQNGANLQKSDVSLGSDNSRILKNLKSNAPTINRRVTQPEIGTQNTDVINVHKPKIHPGNVFLDIQSLPVPTSFLRSESWLGSEAFSLQSRSFVEPSFDCDPLRKWNFDLDMGALYAYRHFKAKNSEPNSLIERRNATERTLGGWSVIFKGNFNWTDKISIWSGLQYDHWIEQSEFNTVQLITEQESVVTNILHLANGSIIENSELITKTRERRTFENHYNSFVRMSVPLGFKYEVIGDCRKSFYLGAFTTLPIYQKYSGFINENESLSAYDLKQDSESHFDIKSTSFGVQFGGDFRLTNSSALKVGMSISKLSNVNTNNYLIDQYYTLFHLSAGYSKAF